MRKQKVKIVRGLPGSGKSYVAEQIAHGIYPDSVQIGGEIATIVSADQFFMTEEGEYAFDPSKLGQAHAQCLENFVDAVHRGYDVIVDNTHSQFWEFKNYIRIAQALGAQVEVVEVQTTSIEQVRVFAERNTHGVPPAVILAMWFRWEEFTDDPSIPVTFFEPGGPGLDDQYTTAEKKELKAYQSGYREGARAAFDGTLDPDEVPTP